MWADSRLGLIAFIVLAAGCSRIMGQDVASSSSSNGVVAAGLPQARMTGRGPAARHQGSGFASLSDHGDLVAYPGNIVRHDGAYIWHRTDVSEQHALNAIAQGRLRLTTPTGEILDFQYDRHIEHPSGDWTWIGHLAGDEGAQTVLTFGDHAVFGTIAQPNKLPLRLTVRDGLGWLLETDPYKLAGIVNAATRPQHPDYRIVPRAELPGQGKSFSPHTAADGAKSGTSQSIAAPAQSATSTAASTVDLLVGYTAGFATANGGASGALTRLNYLVDVANAAYVNSQVDAQVRLVHAMQVTYTETNTNEIALEQLSGYKSGTGSIPPNPAFTALRAARETYKADLVSLVRDFKNPEQDGCGIAWLLGGGLQGIGPNEGWDELGYSVVGDGSDVGTDGKTYFCRDEALTHELGHNMGAAHDRDTAQGDDGKLDNPDDYGAYTYSFGYKTGASSGNFFTIMAYGDTGQTFYRTFSTPKTSFCGNRVCGNATTDNARTLNQTIPVVMGFRAATTRLLKQLDVDGNSKSDLLFFNHGTDQVSFWYMNGTTRVATSSFTLDGSYSLIDTGDLNNDGRTDLLFTSSDRDVVLGIKNASSGYTLEVMPYTYATSQTVVGLADVNGNGNVDILFRDANTGRVTIWYMSGAIRTAYNGVDIDPGLIFVGHGDFNNDAKEDLLWENSGGTVSISLSTGVSYTTTTTALTHSDDYQLSGVQDINGDHKTDILLYSKGLSKLVVWYMDGNTRTAFNSHVVPAGFEPFGKGNFNGDLFGDIVLQNPANSQIQLMLSAGASFETTALAFTPLAASLLMDAQ